MDKLKNVILPYINSLGIILCGTVLGTLLLCIAFLLPGSVIENNVISSMGILIEEKDYFTINQTNVGSTLDNYTEAIYLDEALIDYSHGGVLRTALSGFTYEETPGNRVENLCYVLTKPELRELQATHYRFWNGYEVPLKFLLLFMNYGGIRMINYILVYGLIAVLCIVLHRKKKTKYILPTMLMFIFFCPIAIASNMTFVGFYLCTIIPSILVVNCNDWLVKKNRYCYFFLLIGIIVIYFNMNYFQLCSFGIPVVFYLIVNDDDNGVKQLVIKVCSFFTFWFLGYAGMMVSKWIVYAIMLDPKIFVDMYENIMLRVSATTFGEAPITRMDAIGRNLDFWLYNSEWMHLELAYIFVFFIHIAEHKLHNLDYKMLTLFVLMVVLVLGRYVVFANHVYIHAFVTYRILNISLFAFNVYLMRLMEKNDD